jgi:hypothetical protein
MSVSIRLAENSNNPPDSPLCNHLETPTDNEISNDTSLLDCRSRSLEEQDNR